LLDTDSLRRLFKPECLVLLEGITPITPDLVVGDRESSFDSLQLPTNVIESVMGVVARLAQLKAERSRIMAEGALACVVEPIAQKGVWIEGFTTIHQRKSGKQVSYEYFHLCTWNPLEKREQKRHLGSAKDSRYLQAKEAISRRNRLEPIDRQIERLQES
jgi:hypothetical protein